MTYKDFVSKHIAHESEEYLRGLLSEHDVDYLFIDARVDKLTPMRDYIHAVVRVTIDISKYGLGYFAESFELHACACESCESFNLWKDGRFVWSSSETVRSLWDVEELDLTT